MSASREIPFSRRSPISSSRERVEWPMVKMRIWSAAAMPPLSERCHGHRTPDYRINVARTLLANPVMTYCAENPQQLKRELTTELPSEELRGLCQTQPCLHALMPATNFAARILSVTPMVSIV